MAQYINKDAVLAEIEKLFQQHSSKEYVDEAGCVLDKLEDIINTLEVKEVDLEKVFDAEYSKYSIDAEDLNYTFPVCIADYREFAKQFFDLGVKAQKA